MHSGRSRKNLIPKRYFLKSTDSEYLFLIHAIQAQNRYLHIAQRIKEPNWNNHMKDR